MFCMVGLCGPVFPQVRSADHLGSARFSKLVREKKKNNFIFIIYSMCSKIHPIWMKLSSKLITPSQIQLNQCTTPPLGPPKSNLRMYSLGFFCTWWSAELFLDILWSAKKNFHAFLVRKLKKFGKHWFIAKESTTKDPKSRIYVLSTL
jgi:hypothetical protein